MTNITIQELRAYIALAQTLSFTRAAQLLNLSQPSLSYKLQQLEEKLGTLLFERSSRRVNLTPAGEKILPNAERLLQDLDNTLLHMKQLCQEDNYRIVITCSEGLAASLLTPVISQFQQKFSHTGISILDDSDARVVDNLTSGAAHLGVTSYWPDHSDFLSVPIGSDQLCVLLPSQHPLALDPQINIEQLAGQPFIGLTHQSDPAQLINKLCARAEIELDMQFSASHVSTLMGMVQSGLGISVLPKLKLPPLGVGLVARPLVGSGTQFSLYLVSQVKRPMATQIQLLREMLLERAKDLLS